MHQKINAGALPFQLETSNYGTISATLGENSLVAMAYAGVIAFIIIAIIMILFYRLPGFVAVISLLGQMGLAICGCIRLLPCILFIHNDAPRYCGSYPFNRYGR